jgi:hypothetical protein
MRTIVCLVGLLAWGSASAAGKPKLAVVSLQAPPDLVFTGKSLSQAIADEARRGEGLEVMGPDAVEQKLGREGTGALVRCADDARCLAERGAKLDVDRVVAGWLQRSGDRYSVTLVHVDVRAQKRLAWFRRDVPIASRKLRPDVVAAVPGLLSGQTDAVGTLEIDATVSGATVLVDGVLAGATPLARQLPPGRHKVQVSKAGYAAADPVWLDVPAGGQVHHVQRLFQIPARDRPNNASAAADPGR